MSALFEGIKLAEESMAKGALKPLAPVKPPVTVAEDDVDEGMFDRFKKKSAPKVQDPLRYPERDNIDEWMRSKVDAWKSNRPDRLWMLFCPSFADYLPLNVRSATSLETFKQHLPAYEQLKKENPDAVAEAKKHYTPHNVYPGGPHSDYQ